MQQTVRPVFTVSIAAIVLFQVAALFARSMLDLALRRRGMDSDVAKDLSYLAVPPILLVLMLPYLRRCRHAVGQLFAPRRLTLRVVACSVALGLSLRVMWWASVTLLIGIGIIRSDDPNATVGPIIGWDCPPVRELAFSLFVMSALIPPVEEVVHRGFILHALLPRGTVRAIALSTAVFAVTHEPPYIWPAIAGLFIAVQAIRLRALWGPVITHATFNAAAVIDWDCLRITWNPGYAETLPLALGSTALVVMIAAITMACLLVREETAGAG